MSFHNLFAGQKMSPSSLQNPCPLDASVFHITCIVITDPVFDSKLFVVSCLWASMLKLDSQ